MRTSAPAKVTCYTGEQGKLFRTALEAQQSLDLQAIIEHINTATVEIPIAEHMAKYPAQWLLFFKGIADNQMQARDIDEADASVKGAA